MGQYINKDALVAKIEKLIANGKEECQQSKENNAPGSFITWSEHIDTCGKILSFINTLEVKEVDIDEAARKWEDKVYLEKGWQDKYGTPHIQFSEIGNAFIAGFEFGTKTIKGE